MITRCPACETSFRITEAQLNTAKGAVRCGSCLQIFKAVDNLVPPLVTNDPDNEPDEDFAAGEAPSGKLHFDQSAIDAEGDIADDRLFTDDLLISDDMALDDEDDSARKNPFGDDLDASFFELDISKPAERSLFDRKIKPATHDDEDEQPAQDESWAMELLADEGDDLETALPRTSPDATGVADEATAGRVRSLLRPNAADAADERYDERYLDDAIDSPDTNEPIADPDNDHLIDSLDTDETDGLELEDFTQDKYEYEDEDDREPEQRYRAADEDRNASITIDDDLLADHASERISLLNRIEPAPVEFASYQGRNWKKTLLWGGLSTLGLLLLAGQIAWLRFDSLSRQQPYRDLYATVCPLIGCRLPSLAAPDLIRTSNLVVRSHPQAEGALMVDTILLNTAPFQQPFPDLVLTFSNIHGDTLAARRFAPREYLAGELAGRTSMPSNQPVHLSLEIVDPGPDAVSYSAYIP